MHKSKPSNSQSKPVLETEEEIESNSSDSDRSTDISSPSESSKGTESDDSWHTARTSPENIWHSMTSSSQSSTSSDSSDSRPPINWDISESSDDSKPPSNWHIPFLPPKGDSSSESNGSTKSFTPTLFKIRTNNDLYLAKTKLGEGTYGTVYRAKRDIDRSDDSDVAIKVLSVQKINQSNIDWEECIVKILMAKPHPNIVRYIVTQKTPNGAVLISELSPIGDIYEVMQIENENGNKIWVQFDENLTRHLIIGIAKGLQHLHGLSIAHGDLKLHNVLLFPNTDNSQIEYRVAEHRGITRIDRWISKLTDFSNCQIGNPNNPSEPIIRNQQFCANTYAAPESCERIEYDCIKADIFSLGCCLLSMLLGAVPFTPPLEPLNYALMPTQTQINKHNDQMTLYCNQMKYGTGFKRKIVRMCSYPLRNLLNGLLESNPQNRINLDQFFAHQWITRPQSREFEDIYDGKVLSLSLSWHPYVDGIQYLTYPKEY